MTEIDLDALEATARAATQQERWKVTDLRGAPDGNRDCIWIDTDSTTTYATIAEMNDEDGLFPLWGIEDATHIAAFDPPTVLALIARLRTAESVVKDYDANFPCDGGCNVNDGPEETCSRHGRSPSDLWERVGNGYRAAARLREAEAVLAEIRVNAAELLDADDDSYDGSLSATWVVELIDAYKTTKTEKEQDQ